MNRSRLAPLLIAALLLLAGCAGTLPGTDDVGGGADADAYPPGVTDSTVNATALTDAHRSALNGSSLTVSVSIDQQIGNRSQSVSAVQRVGPDHEAILSTVDMETGSRAIYLTEDTQYVRVTFNNQSRYDVRPRSRTTPGQLMISPTATDLVNWTLTSGNFTVAGTEERDGTTLTTLTASSLTANATRPTQGTLAGFNATAVVDERGVVRSLSYSVELEREGRTYVSSVSLNVTDVGSTDVAEPDWLEEAKNRSESTTRA